MIDIDLDFICDPVISRTTDCFPTVLSMRHFYNVGWEMKIDEWVADTAEPIKRIGEII